MDQDNLPTEAGYYYVMMKNGAVEIAKVAPFKLSTGFHVTLHNGNKALEWGIDCEWQYPKDISKSPVSYFIGPVPKCKRPGDRMTTRILNNEWENKEIENPLISREMKFILKCQAVAKLEIELEKLNKELDEMSTKPEAEPEKESCFA